MKIKDQQIVKSLLGDDIFDTLRKFEIYKPETRSVVDPKEIKIALEIVPRSVLSFLFAHLKWREPGDNVDLDLPFAPDAKLHIDKKGPDNYHGEIIKDGKVVSKFQHRSLPSIGLILLTTFELYDIALLDEIKEYKPEEIEDEEYDNRSEKLQDVIDERFMMHRLVQDVVDRRISEREAISKIIKERLDDHIKSTTIEESREKEFREEKSMEKCKKSKLREFLESREKKRQEPVELDKAEISCPDCGTVLYKTEGKNKIKLCICYGQFHGHELKFIKKGNNKIQIKFPKNFDLDNIEMLLDTVKKDWE